MKIDRSSFSSLQLPWKMAQARKKFVDHFTLPMVIHTKMIKIWSDIMFPNKEKK